MYVRVHACSKQCRACNHPRARPLPFLRPTNHPRRAQPLLCSSTKRAATILTMPYQPLPLPICSATDHPHRPRLPYRHPRHPPQLTAVSTTRTTTTTTHSFSPVFLSRRTCLSLFPFLFPLPSSSNARSNPARRVRPYPWRASTGTPARSLKENAIIRRTSTNELIVGASRYRQCREVLYSTSPGATRL